MARSSVSSPALTDVYASTACVRASRPVAAVTVFGISTVYSGLMTATSGTRQSPFNSILIPFSVSVTIVNLVASEPVPAVVGIATIGGTFPSIIFPL